MMIVGTVQQEEDCSWQDACRSWMGQDEEVAAGVYQVGTCQEAVEQSTAGQCKKAGIMEAGEEASEPDDLLLEGKEQEYFLELLMRKASPERPKAGQPEKNRDNSKDKAASAKGKEKKRDKRKEKKALGKSKEKKKANGQERGEGATGQTSGLEKQTALDLLNNPEVKGRGLVDDNREKKEQATGSQVTSRGECSRQKMPDST